MNTFRLSGSSVQPSFRTTLLPGEEDATGDGLAARALVDPQTRPPTNSKSKTGSGDHQEL
jgi:hypothetical protein